MAIETDIQAETAVEATNVDESPLVIALSKLGLALIGAVSLALEAGGKMMQRMVERGEVDERKARRVLSKFRQRRPHLRRPPYPVITLDTKNLASKEDIQALEQQIAALSAQVEHLNKGTPEGA